MTNLVDVGPRRLGPLGDVGALGFGLWRFVDGALERRVALAECAIESGMNLFDTADVYGLDWGGTGFGTVETALGEVLAAQRSLRDRIVLATKGGIVPPVPYDSSGPALRAACEASLRRLGVDTIDLYQIHRPDLFAHPAEVADTLGGLVQSGKVRAIGVSNHTPAQVDALRTHLGVPLVSNQPEYSVAHLDPLRDGTFDACLRDGTVPLAWSPLAGGRVVSGEGLRPELVAVLDALAEREGVERADVAVAFVLAHPSRPVALLGTQRPERLRMAARAGQVRLDRSDVYAIVQASEGVPLP